MDWPKRSGLCLVRMIKILKRQAIKVREIFIVGDRYAREVLRKRISFSIKIVFGICIASLFSALLC